MADGAPKPRGPRLGLRAKLTLAFLALSVAPLLLAILPLSYTAEGALRESIEARGMAALVAVTAPLQATYERARSDVRFIAAALGNRDAPIDARIRFANQHFKESPDVTEYTVFGPKGKELDTAYKPDSEPLPKDAEFAANVAKQMKELVHEGCVSSHPVRIPGRPPYERYACPVFWEEGETTRLYAIVTAVIRLDRLDRAVVEATTDRFGDDPGAVYVVGASGIVLAHPDAAMVGKRAPFLSSEGTLKDFADNFAQPIETKGIYEVGGEEVYILRRNLPEYFWAVVVEQPYRIAQRATYFIVYLGVGLGAGFALLAILLGLFLGRRLAAPVVEVADAAGKVAAGDFEVSVPVRTRDETGELAHAFNTMAADLKSYRERLVEETRIRGDLTRFLNQELVEAVVEGQTELKLGGHRTPVTVLFADVVAFTPLAEQHDPEYVVKVLNELFTFLTEIVFKHGGIVDKFIGDCVMAVFGAPDPTAEDAANAVSAAEEMMSWLEVGNAKWRRELGRELQIGVGMNSGPVVLGNIGSERRMEYTVIGDVVNVAARLEQLAQPGQILMTRATRDAVQGDFETASLGEHKVLGRDKAVEVFELSE